MDSTPVLSFLQPFVLEQVNEDEEQERKQLY